MDVKEDYAKSENLGLLFAFLCAVLFCFQLFNQLRVEWSANDQYAYGWFVPILAAVLFWRRWLDRPSGAHREKTGCSKGLWASVFLVLLLAILPLRWVEEANFRWRGAWWAHALVLVALSFLVIRQIGGASRVRHFAFPILFLLVAIPWPTRLESPFVQDLMRLVAGTTVELVRIVAIPALRHGNLIEIGSGVVSVDGACSGVRSLQTALMLTLLFGEAFRLRLWPRIALVPLGFALAFLANVARTSLLTWGAATRGMDYMEHKLHDPAGVGVVIVVLAGIYLTALWLSREHSVFALDPGVRGQESGVRAESTGVRRQASGVNVKKTDAGDQTPERADKDTGATADLLPPPPVASPLTPDSRQLTPGAPGHPPSLTPDSRPLTSAKLLIFAAVWLAVVECTTALWFHLGDLRAIPNPVWSINWPTNAVGYTEIKMKPIETEMLQYDDAKKASWQDETGNHWSLISLRWAPENKNSFNGLGHSPDVCFVGAGWQLRSEPEPVWVPVNSIDMPFRRFVFNVDGKTAYAFMGFWDERSLGGRQEEASPYGILQRVKAAWKGKRNQGFKKLEIAIIGPSSVDEALSVLRDGLQRLIVVEGPGVRSQGSGVRGEVSLTPKGSRVRHQVSVFRISEIRAIRG